MITSFSRLVGAASPAGDTGQALAACIHYPAFLNKVQHYPAKFLKILPTVR